MWVALTCACSAQFLWRAAVHECPCAHIGCAECPQLCQHILYSQYPTCTCVPRHVCFHCHIAHALWERDAKSAEVWLKGKFYYLLPHYGEATFSMKIHVIGDSFYGHVCIFCTVQKLNASCFVALNIFYPVLCIAQHRCWLTHAGVLCKNLVVFFGATNTIHAQWCLSGVLHTDAPCSIEQFCKDI